MALSDATIPGQSGPGSNGNEGVLRISQSISITATSLLFSVIYRNSSGEALTPLLRISRCILQPKPTG